MSTTTCFRAEIRKLSVLFGWKKRLIWSYDFAVLSHLKVWVITKHTLDWSGSALFALASLSEYLLGVGVHTLTILLKFEWQFDYLVICLEKSRLNGSVDVDQSDLWFWSTSNTGDRSTAWRYLVDIPHFVYKIILNQYWVLAWRTIPYNMYTPLKTQISLHICPVWSVFAIHLKKTVAAWLSTEHQDWSDCMNAWACLSLHIWRYIFLVSAQLPYLT